MLVRALQVGGGMEGDGRGGAAAVTEAAALWCDQAFLLISRSQAKKGKCDYYEECGMLQAGA